MTNGSTQPPAPASSPAAPESFWEKIKNFFHHAEQTAEQDFLNAWHEFEPAAKALLQTELGTIARVAVTNAESLLNDTEKATAASTAIATAAEQAGITVKDSLVNLLREIALQDLQGTLTTSAPKS